MGVWGAIQGGGMDRDATGNDGGAQKHLCPLVAEI